MGDNFYDTGVANASDPRFEESWVDVYLRYPSLNIPWYLCLGNVDYMGNTSAQARGVCG